MPPEVNTCPCTGTQCTETQRITDMHTALLGEPPSLDPNRIPGAIELLKKLLDNGTARDAAIEKLTKMIVGNGKPGYDSRLLTVETTIAQQAAELTSLTTGVSKAHAAAVEAAKVAKVASDAAAALKAEAVAEAVALKDKANAEAEAIKVKAAADAKVVTDQAAEEAAKPKPMFAWKGGSLIAFGKWTVQGTYIFIVIVALSSVWPWFGKFWTVLKAAALGGATP